MTDRPVALVTGAARGIGWATALELSRNGWFVVAADIDEAAVKARESSAPNLLATFIDVTDRQSVERAVDTALSIAGELDVLVNNAGMTRIAPFEAFRAEDWMAVLDVDLNGVLYCMQSAGRHMLAQGRGSIVNITSIAAQRGVPGRAAYAAAKAAIVSLTQTAAVEWASRGVRVNAVGPGYVKTELVGSLVEAGTVPVEAIIERTPLGRFATPEEVARAVRFVASTDASFMTGQVLYLDGGFLADYGIPFHSPTTCGDDDPDATRPS